MANYTTTGSDTFPAGHVVKHCTRRSTTYGAFSSSTVQASDVYDTIITSGNSGVLCWMTIDYRSNMSGNTYHSGKVEIHKNVNGGSYSNVISSGINFFQGYVDNPEGTEPEWMEWMVNLQWYDPGLSAGTYVYRLYVGKSNSANIYINDATTAKSRTSLWEIKE